MFDYRGGFSGSSYPMHGDIADFDVRRDVAMATIFGFLYTGCTLAPPTVVCGGDAALCQITLTICFFI